MDQDFPGFTEVITKDFFSNYVSVKNINVSRGFEKVIINVDIDEIEYIADILTVGKIDKQFRDYISDHVKSKYDIDFNINMISPMNRINVNITI